MSLPDAEALWAAMDGTWAPARLWREGVWTLREGKGGGQRVSAATVNAAFTTQDIAQAEDAMRAVGQDPIFQIRPEDAALDTALAGRGYAIKDPVHLYACATRSITATAPNPNQIFHTWPPLAIQRELWIEGGIGPGRVSVMARAQGPHTAFLARHKDQPAGVAYAAIHDGIAMIHALEVRPAQRRAGVAAQMMCAFAHWAQDNGAGNLALAVTKENFAANALYAKYGMSVVTSYHYRRKQKND